VVVICIDDEDFCLSENSHHSSGYYSDVSIANFFIVIAPRKT